MGPVKASSIYHPISFRTSCFLNLVFCLLFCLRCPQGSQCTSGITTHAGHSQFFCTLGFAIKAAPSCVFVFLLVLQVQ